MNEPTTQAAVRAGVRSVTPESVPRRADRVLVIEDVEADFHLLERQLQRAGLGQHCRQVTGSTSLDQALASGRWDVVLADHQLPGFDFNTQLSRLRRELPDVPIILVSGTIGEELAVDLTRKHHPAILRGLALASGPAVRPARGSRRSAGAIRTIRATS